MWVSAHALETCLGNVQCYSLAHQFYTLFQQITKSHRLKTKFQRKLIQKYRDSERMIQCSYNANDIKNKYKKTGLLLASDNMVNLYY